jgi:hypothetical protein
VKVIWKYTLHYGNWLGKEELMMKTNIFAAKSMSHQNEIKFKRLVSEKLTLYFCLDWET